jgi:hypothetical protein
MKTEISVAATFKRPSAFLPIAMSVIAVAVIIVHIAGSGTAPEKDEGTAAHLWQLLIAAQVPIVAFFIFKWIPQAPRATLSVLAAQIAMALLALAPIYFLKW